jgi:tetratricopeptide (TPR) repeat protein
MVAITALHGLGGIGKTQLALEYAYRHLEHYRAILWVHADSPQALLASYLDLAKLLGIALPDQPEATTLVRALKGWFQKNIDWLIIFDNVETELLPQIIEVVPPLARGHVLLTTRSQALGPCIQSLPVEVMEAREGAYLLLRRSRLIARDTPLEEITTSLFETARKITTELGGLRLALDQAGAYIEENGCSLDDYLALYYTNRSILLGRRGHLSGKDYAHTVATTWDLSFSRIEAMNSGAGALLQLCAFLQPDAIYEEMLLAEGVDLGEPLNTLRSDPLRWQEALGLLSSYSLLRRHPEHKILSLHRLVQLALQERMDEQTQRLWAERVVRLLNRNFPALEILDESFNPSLLKSQRYLPQAYVAASLITHWQMDFLEAGQLLARLDAYLDETAIYTQAVGYLEAARPILEKHLPPIHPELKVCWHDLAIVYHHLGKYAASASALFRTLEICWHIFGPLHEETIIIICNIAWLYRDLGRYADAEALLLDCLASLEHAFEHEPEHIIRPLKLHAFASIPLSLVITWFMQERTEKYAEAEILLQCALAVNEEYLGAEHLATLGNLARLGELYMRQGRYAQAEQLIKQVLTVHRRIDGEEHLRTLKVVGLLAHLYDLQGDYAEANVLHRQILDTLERLFGAEHPEIADSLYALARHYDLQGLQTQAEPLYRRALAIRMAVLGSDHPTTVATRKALSAVTR